MSRLGLDNILTIFLPYAPWCYGACTSGAPDSLTLLASLTVVHTTNSYLLAKVSVVLALTLSKEASGITCLDLSLYISPVVPFLTTIE